MATTIPVLSAFLDAHDIKHNAQDDSTIVTGFGGLDHYRDAGGDPHLGLVIRLEEEGEYVKVFAPNAYRVPLEDVGPVLQACAMIQWRTKLVQFEYDASDGELRPIVEFPLEDAPMTDRQLMRCVSGLVSLVDHFHPVIQRALTDGDIVFEDAPQDSEVEMLSRLLGGFSPEILADALRRADERRN